jgi:hypothetical protein
MGLVGAIRPYKICRYLPEKGWVPEVITVNPRKGLKLDFTLSGNIPGFINIYRTKNFDPIIMYREYCERKTYKNKINEKELSNKYSPSEYGKNNDKKYNIWGEIKNTLFGLVSTPDHQVFWNYFVLKEGYRVLRRDKNKNIRFIMTSSPPHSSQIGGILLAMCFKIPYIVDYRDPWNDIYLFKKSHVRKIIETAMESFIIKRARYVISTSRTYSDALRNRFKRICDGEKFICITNSYEKELFESIIPTESPVFTISYLGIFYPQYQPYYFFKVLSEYVKRNNFNETNIKLKIIGNVDSSTSGALKENDLLGVTEITGRVSREEAIRIAKSSDLLLLLMGTTELTPRGWIPTKLIEYLACGKTILGILPEGEAAEIIRETNTGYAITGEDEEAILKAIQTEHGRKINGSSRADERNMKAIEFFSNDNVITRFSELFDSI